MIVEAYKRDGTKECLFSYRTMVPPQVGDLVEWLGSPPYPALYRGTVHRRAFIFNKPRPDRLMITLTLEERNGS